MTAITASQHRSALAPTADQHDWITESRHTTSAGNVVYLRCAGCGIRRVDLRRAALAPQLPISAEIGAGGAHSSDSSSTTDSSSSADTASVAVCRSSHIVG